MVMPLSIVEEKDATDKEREINEIFTGVLCGPKSLLDEGSIPNQ
jgi:bifunctional N-acetylglucosamine-1-phosphate-uridyltransferase/glucosamine-1-phosphate-acetyltransferase GlmU-like protein